ncbi:hypothetical protein I553_9842 [Mycobacterium xenopi 4042]|uniref:Uncharacterized protein n=1 Tax=Mycobacterium xenopi 4042 TaxID=1299334 RepID=X7YQZ3_MYCXE|nr:hypothetical protein I553_9842 [Mycobacterium xenopi 4042]
MSQRQQFFESVVGQLQHLQHLISAQSLAAMQHLLAGQVQDVGAGPSRRLGHRVLPYILICADTKPGQARRARRKRCSR